MIDRTRSYEVSYSDPSADDGTHDVSFELSEDAEEALFTALSYEISDRIDNGMFPEHWLHLFKKINDQHNKFPPWVVTDDGVRTYDLELTNSDYRLLTEVIGKSLRNVIRPDGADPYRELLVVWEQITQQMKDNGPDFDPVTIEREEPSDETFDCFIRNMQFRKHSSGDGFEEWVECNDCGATMTQEDIDDHDC